MMKKRIISMDTRTNDLKAGTAQLKDTECTDQKSLKQFKNSYTLMEEVKVDFDEMMHKIERLRISMNSMPPLEYGAVEKVDSDSDDAFLEAVSITENVFTYETVLLPSVEVRVIVNEEYIPVRALMHLGSTFHMITNKCRERLNLPLLPAKPTLDPLAENPTGLLGTTLVTFIPYFANTPKITIEAYVTQNAFADSPAIKVHPSIKDYLRNFQLADPKFDMPGEVELMFNMLPLPNYTKSEVRYRIPGTHCSIFDSALGWAVVGRAPVEEIRPSLWTQRAMGRIATKLEEAEHFFHNVRPDVLLLL